MQLHKSHIISASQFTDTNVLSSLFALAKEMEEKDLARTLAPSLQGKLLAMLFYEPSTRTRFSFEAAMKKLGGDTLTTENASEFSSAVKGETLEDSIRVIGNYADVIVLRHPEKGASERAAQASPVPLINAGDGAGEHPTQALLDLYTIEKARGNIDGAHIALLGDLRHGRTVHSLLSLLALYKNITCYLVSPETLALPEEYLARLSASGAQVHIAHDINEVLQVADVLYMTRIQKERFADKEAYERVKDCYVLTKERTLDMKPEAIIMHPLPRNNEIAPEVDSDIRAHYFTQAKNGLYLRMALLQKILIA